MVILSIDQPKQYTWDLHITRPPEYARESFEIMEEIGHRLESLGITYRIGAVGVQPQPLYQVWMRIDLRALPEHYDQWEVRDSINAILLGY